jgi:nicotinic acid mononucleotide adenylyltransferase
MRAGSPPGRRAVCLFGTCADPPTVAHVAMVQALLQDAITNLSEIRILPVYQPRYKQATTTFDHRWALCEAAFLPLNKSADTARTNTPLVTVSDAEYQCWRQHFNPVDPARNGVGTAALLDYLGQQPGSEEEYYYFMLGADSFIDLMADHWLESARIREMLQGRFLVVPRQASHDEALSLALAREPRAKLLPILPHRTVSSTRVRNCGNVAEMATLVTPAVLAYIQQHGLYALHGGQANGQNQQEFIME